MLSFVGAILIGFVGLVWSADRFVASAAATAKSLGMAPIMIGLTIVALGTSAPEILVSVEAARSNASDLAVGNAIGSNLANIGLVLGITALVAPIPVSRKLLTREVPILVGITMVGAYCLSDHHLGRIDGAILLTCLIAMFTWLVINKSSDSPAQSDQDLHQIPSMTPLKAKTWLILSLIILVVSADTLVWGAKEAALALGVSQLVIGLTIIAVGTSLPELAASVVSALKGHHDIALGNIIGSNILNLLAVLPVPALIAPTALNPQVFFRDYSTMAAITLLLTMLLFLAVKFTRKEKKPRLGRFVGILLLMFYGAYYMVLFQPSF